MPKVKPPTEIQQHKINELKSLAQGYRTEIPAGRSPWPACIRDRVFELATSGMSYCQISGTLGVERVIDT